MAIIKTKEELYAALDATVAGMQQNETFLSRIGKTSLSLTFTVSDLGAEYSFYFEEGTCRGAIGGGITSAGYFYRHPEITAADIMKQREAR